MDTALSRLTLAAHIMRALARTQSFDHAPTLEGLVEELAVPRADVRRALSELHEEGLVDVTRMRLTMHGFALGVSLGRRQLAPLSGKPRAPRSSRAARASRQRVIAA